MLPMIRCSAANPAATAEFAGSLAVERFIGNAERDTDGIATRRPPLRFRTAVTLPA
jgi:hypothetical protein